MPQLSIKLALLTLTAVTGAAPALAAAPTVSVQPHRDGFIYFHTATFDESSTRCDMDPVVPSKLVVRITSGGQHVQMTMSDPCLGWDGGGDRSGYQLNLDPQLPGDAHFRPVWTRNGTHRVEVAVLLNGVVTRRLHYRIRARVQNTPGSRVRFGTDGFVNICVNEGRMLRSEGGVLFCTIPAFSKRRYSLTRS